MTTTTLKMGFCNIPKNRLEICSAAMIKHIRYWAFLSHPSLGQFPSYKKNHEDEMFLVMNHVICTHRP